MSQWITSPRPWGRRLNCTAKSRGIHLPPSAGSKMMPLWSRSPGGSPFGQPTMALDCGLETLIPQTQATSSVWRQMARKWFLPPESCLSSSVSSFLRESQRGWPLTLSLHGCEEGWRNEPVLGVPSITEAGTLVPILEINQPLSTMVKVTQPVNSRARAGSRLVYPQLQFYITTSVNSSQQGCSLSREVGKISSTRVPFWSSWHQRPLPVAASVSLCSFSLPLKLTIMPILLTHFSTLVLAFFRLWTVG